MKLEWTQRLPLVVCICQFRLKMCLSMVGPPGLEPGIGRLKVCCDNHFTTIPYLSWIVFQVPIQTDMGSGLTLWFSWSLHIVFRSSFNYTTISECCQLFFFWCPTTESNCHHRITKPVYCHCTSRAKIGSSGWDRTTDTLINSQVQLPLCYWGIFLLKNQTDRPWRLLF